MKIRGTVRNEEIAGAVSRAEQYLQRKGVEEKMRLSVRVALEEILLICRSAADEAAEFELDIRKGFGEILCSLSVSGPEVGPDLADGEILRRLFSASLLPEPRREYRNGRNRFVLTVPLYDTTFHNLKFAWSYVRQYRKTFFFAIGCQWLNVILSIVAPILSARIIIAYSDSQIRQIILTAIAIFFVNAVSNLSLYFCNTRYNMVYTRLLSDMENDLASSTLRITGSCMDSKGTGLFIQRLTADTSTLATGFNTIADLLSQMFRYIGILIAMLIVSPPVFFVVLLLLAGQIAIELIRTRRLMEDDRIHRNAAERFSGFVSEMVHGVSDIKVLNSENAFQEEVVKRIEDANNSYMHMLMKSWKYKLSRWGVGEAGRLVFTCLLAVLILKYGMAPALALVLFNYYSELGAPAVLILGQFLEFLKNFDLSTERVCAIMNNPEFPKERFGQTHLESVRGEIRFEHVNARYESHDPRFPNRDILKDMSFVIPAGTTAAFVGRSGCGKSTVLRLISRLIRNTGGTIFLDGTDISTLDRESIRGNMTVVSQAPYLFHLSVRDNLRLVKPDLTEEEMVEACRAARIADDIERMPQKYDTVIGEGGVDLSGGQRQRLAIARCLLRDSSIILLDEATSSLDNVTQAEILKALEEHRKDRTVIMIAHRLSTVVHADMILFVEDGKILDFGTHQELLERCGSYRQLYEQEIRPA